MIVLRKAETILDAYHTSLITSQAPVASDGAEQRISYGAHLLCYFWEGLGIHILIMYEASS